MNPLLAIVRHEEEVQTEGSPTGLVEFLGITTRIALIGARGLDPLVGTESEPPAALLVSASCLCILERSGVSPLAFLEKAMPPGTSIMVHGFLANPEQEALALGLSKGGVRGMTFIRDGWRLAFRREAGSLVGPLAGCRFEREPGPRDAGFELADETVGVPIMEIGRIPVFIRIKGEANPIFLWANGDPIPGPEDGFSPSDVTRRCDRFLPLLVFLRYVFGGYCWENPVKTARVILDDPLLTRRYGFIQYEQLLRLTRHLGCGVTTAFIPWNWQRTTERDARRFRDFIPEHSICVHGCDHTGNEFGKGTEGELAARAVVALRRLDSHQERTGIESSRVLVFPQGRFSIRAMRALRRAGFAGVVNTSCLPGDEAVNTLPLTQWLQPAVTKYSGLPLFVRRYPVDLEMCALDLFLGKPAHLVQHHEWFRNGSDDFERCVRWLQRIQPGLSWPSLDESLPRQHLRRAISSDKSTEIRFFTPRFVFDNPSTEVGDFLFSKPEPDCGLVESVTINDNRVHFDLAGGMVSFRRVLRPLERLRIAVNIKHCRQGLRWTVGGGCALVATCAAANTCPNCVQWPPPIKQRVRTAARRYLSEVRDNYLVKHPAVLKASKDLIGALRIRSG